MQRQTQPPGSRSRFRNAAKAEPYAHQVCFGVCVQHNPALTLMKHTRLLLQVHLCERIPWHEALYFVTTTLTTVGYGDMVPTTTIGKLAVLAMICVGVVVIPVQTSQVYSQLTARRVTLGAPVVCSGKGTVCSWDTGRHGAETWPLAGQAVPTGMEVFQMHLWMRAALGGGGSAASAALFCRPITCNQAAYQKSEVHAVWTLYTGPCRGSAGSAHAHSAGQHTADRGSRLLRFLC